MTAHPVFAFDYGAPLASAATALRSDYSTQVHVAVFLLHWALNVAALVAVNRLRASPGFRSPPLSARSLLAWNYALFFSLVLIYTHLDAVLPAPTVLSIPFQGYAGAFSVGVLDFYLCPHDDSGGKRGSSHDPRRQLRVAVIVQGALLWLACDWATNFVAGRWWWSAAGTTAGTERVLRSNWWHECVAPASGAAWGCARFVAAEWGRFLFWLLGAGLGTDFFFSPVIHLQQPAQLPPCVSQLTLRPTCPPVCVLLAAPADAPLALRGRAQRAPRLHGQAHQPCAVSR